MMSLQLLLVGVSLSQTGLYEIDTLMGLTNWIDLVKQVTFLVFSFRLFCKNRERNAQTPPLIGLTCCKLCQNTSAEVTMWGFPAPHAAGVIEEMRFNIRHTAYI